MENYWTILVNLKRLVNYQLLTTFVKHTSDLNKFLIIKVILTLMIKIMNLKILFSVNITIKQIHHTLF